MRFEARELRDFVEPVPANDLVVGGSTSGWRSPIRI